MAKHDVIQTVHEPFNWKLIAGLITPLNVNLGTKFVGISCLYTFGAVEMANQNNMS